MWLETAVGGLLLLAFWQAIVLMRTVRQLRHLQRNVGAWAQNMAAAGTDVPTSMVVTALGRIEQHLRMLESPQATPALPYELAQQLAREGADVNTLVARCGLSRDEARLILQLYTATH